MVGDFAISKAGHDKNEIYVIVEESTDVVYLCDGRLKKLDRPKKKNFGHIQIIKDVPEEIRATCYQKDTFYNEGIKKALKDYGHLVMSTQTRRMKNV